MDLTALLERFGEPTVLGMGGLWYFRRVERTFADVI